MQKNEKDVDNVKVYARFRPAKGDDSHLTLDEGESILMVKRDFEKRVFSLNGIFKGDNNSQTNVYREIGRPITDSVIKGYNGSILAYGQTGSGKTHSMIGKKDGILPQSVKHILEVKQEARIHLFIGAIQIYNEQISDMLASNDNVLKMKEVKKNQIFDEMSWSEIETYSDAEKCFNKAESVRCVGYTSMNKKSSRSHAIFMLRVLNRDNGRKSTLYLVDLAGSERIKKSHVSGERIEEAISINSSLTTLGKCIIALSEKKTNHIPYRESQLTKLLKDSLGGNCKTALVITLSPDMEDIDETISSLLFGQRARRVQIKASLTPKKSSKAQYNEEIVILKKQLSLKQDELSEKIEENEILLDKIANLESRDSTDKSVIKKLKRDHQIRLEEANSIMLEYEKRVQDLEQLLEEGNKENLSSSSRFGLNKRDTNIKSSDELSDIQHILEKEKSRLEIERNKLEDDKIALKRERENLRIEKQEMELFTDEYEERILEYEEKLRAAESERDQYQSRIQAKFIDNDTSTDRSNDNDILIMEDLRDQIRDQEVLLEDKDHEISGLNEIVECLRQELDSKTNEYVEENEELRKTTMLLRSELDEAESQISKVAKQRDDLMKLIDVKDSEIKSRDKKIHELESNNAESMLMEELESQKNKLGELTRVKRDLQLKHQEELCARDSEIQGLKSTISELKLKSEVQFNKLRSDLEDLKNEKESILGSCANIDQIKQKILENTRPIGEDKPRIIKIDEIISDAKQLVKKSIQEGGEECHKGISGLSEGQIKGFLVEKITKVFFSDMNRSIYNSSSLGEIMRVLVTEISCSRLCIDEMVFGMDKLLLNLAEREITNKYQEESLGEYKQLCMRFRGIISDPDFEDFRKGFLEAAVQHMLKERAARTLQRFFKRRKQRNRLMSLKKRHRSQYEMFQAGLGKYHLQLLMKKAESLFFNLNEEIKHE